jgi:hypothetical protein
MRPRLSFLLGLVALGCAVFAAAPAKAATAPGPYYATPSWDQQLQCDTPATCPRFIVLSNWGGAAALDRETGLVWEVAPEVGRPQAPVLRLWEEAFAHCINLEVGGRKGWRLPTLEELMSLVDPTQSSPALPSGNPFVITQLGPFWTSTTINIDSLSLYSTAAGVSFENGDYDEYSRTAPASLVDEGFAWCVRGGHGVFYPQ